MLNKHDLKFKEFLKMQDRLWVLQEKLRNLPSVKLDKPYNDGWVISYRLRDDARRRKDFPILQEVLDLGYATSHTSNLNFVKAIRRGDKILTYTKKKKKVRVDLRPGTYSIPEKKYLTFSPEVKKYFILDTTSDPYKLRGVKIYYASISSYYLKLRVKPHTITHTVKKGGDIETEVSFLRDKLDEFWREQDNYSKSYPAFKDRAKVRAKIQKFKKGELDDIYNDKIPLEYDY